MLDIKTRNQHFINGLDAIDPPNIGEYLLAEIASEIDSYMI